MIRPLTRASSERQYKGYMNDVLYIYINICIYIYIYKTVSLMCVLLALLLLCISSISARITEHAKWVCLCTTVRMLLSPTKESNKWWFYCKSATPTKAQFYNLCMILCNINKSTVLQSMHDFVQHQQKHSSTIYA
jgi:hypothetical protein